MCSLKQNEGPPLAQTFTGNLDKDRIILGEHLSTEGVQAPFPPAAPSSGGRNGSRPAEAVDLSVRESFLAIHMDDLYDELTRERTEYPRLAELADRAAEALPGLVPTTSDIEADHGRGQQYKSGREQELGIFFGAVLDAPGPGSHFLESMRRPTGRALEMLPTLHAAGRVDLGPVYVEFRNGTGHVVIDNQRYLNAEDDAVVEALETAVDLVLLDDRATVGVLRGAPMTHPRYRDRRVFSSGINLTHLYEGRISLLGFLLRRELGYISKIYRGLSGPRTTEKPWIAAVDTFAIGGGAQLTLVFDHVIADSDAYYTLPALQEGIIPGAANLRLGRFLGPRASRQMIFANRRVRATDAAGAVLTDEVVPPAELDRAIENAAARLSNPAVVANRRMLRIAEEPLDAFRTYMADYAREQSCRLYSEDLIANLERSWIRRSRT